MSHACHLKDPRSIPVRGLFYFFLFAYFFFAVLLEVIGLLRLFTQSTHMSKERGKLHKTCNVQVQSLRLGPCVVSHSSLNKLEYCDLPNNSLSGIDVVICTF